MFRLINDWLKLQQSEIPFYSPEDLATYLYPRKYQRKSAHGTVKWNIPWRALSLITPCSQRLGGGWKGKSLEFSWFFFLQFSLFPPSALPAESHSSLGSWGSALLPLPQSWVGHICKKFNPNPIPTSSCVQGKEGKNRNSMSLEKMHKAQTAGPPGKSNQVFISQAEEFQLFYIFRLWRTTSRHLKGTRSCPEWWQSSFKAFGIYKSKEITFWEATAAHFEQGDGERRGERSPLCSVGLSTTRPFPLSIANWGEIGKKADKCDVSGRFLNSKPQ